MDPTTGSKIIENLSQEWTDLEVLNFLHNCPQMLKESFCFRTLMGYNFQMIGGDHIVMLFVGDDPKRSLYISLAKSDSSKSFLSNAPIIPTISYHLDVTRFDFEATYRGLGYAIREQKEKIRKESGRVISEHDALAILFRKNCGIVDSKNLLSADYKKKYYWGWVRRLISLFHPPDQNTQRQEQIFMILKRMDEAINEVMHNFKLNNMQNLRYFAG